MIKVTRSDGTLFDFDSLYKIVSVEGLGEISQQIFTESKAVGDGEIITGTRLGGRTVKIKAVCIQPELNNISRRVVSQFFNPKFTYKAKIAYKGSDVYIDCIVDTADLPTANIYEPQEFYLTLYSASPYLKSNDEFGENIASVYGVMGYPKVYPIDSGYVNSAYLYGSTVYVENDGDVETFCKAVVTAKGDVTNFSFNNGGYYVRILDTMVSGDIYVIDFETQSITKNGVNAIRLIDRTSKWWSIERGGANIGYTADSGDSLVNVTVYYNKLYTGV